MKIINKILNACAKARPITVTMAAFMAGKWYSKEYYGVSTFLLLLCLINIILMYVDSER